MPEQQRPARRRRFKLAYLAPVFLVLALLGWAYASPAGSSPDDDFHLASIWCANPANTSACLPGPTEDTRYVPESFEEDLTCYRFYSEAPALCQEAAYPLDPTPNTLTSRGSFSSNYPPIYYFAMSLFVGPDILVSILVMRLVNILLFVGMTTLVYALLPRSLRPPFVWSWLISIVPLGVFLLGSNNPSAWALIGVGTVWASLLGYMRTSGPRKVGLGILFAVGVIMAAGARADAAIYAGISIAIVLFLTATFTRKFFIDAILPAVFGIVAVLLFFGSGQSSVAVEGLGSVDELPIRTFEDAFKFNILNVADVVTGSFGSWQLGWLDVNLPPIVMFLTAGTFAGVAFAGMTFVTWRKTIAFAAVGTVIFALPLYVLTAGGNIVGEVLQPRYLLPLILLFAGLVLLPVGADRLRLSPVQLLIIIASLTGANAVAMQLNIRRYISGSHLGGLNLNNYVDWWWPGLAITPMMVWIGGSLVFGIAVALIAWELYKNSGPIIPVAAAASAVDPDPSVVPDAALDAGPTLVADDASEAEMEPVTGGASVKAASVKATSVRADAV